LLQTAETAPSACRDAFDHLALPLICAPMFLVSYPELIIAACRQNIGAACSAMSARSSQEYDEWLDRIEAARAAHLASGAESAGMVATNLTLRSGKDGARARYESDLLVCKRRRSPLVITINGAPDEVVQEVHGWGGMVFHDVTSIRHAEKAAAAGVDGMILIASGGGGHSGALHPFTLVSAVREFFNGYLVLAGAITHGAHLRAARALGADLCYMGTRFIATQESGAPPAYKQMLVEAKATDLLFTPYFTHGVPANILKPSIAEAGYDPAALPDRLVQPPREDRRAWRDIWSAGQGAELIRDIPTVAELVERLREEYRASAERAG
jgi:nitronate monooxygenase